MMRLNSAVAREVSAELERQAMTAKAITFWLNVGTRKAKALCDGSTIWTMAELEEVAEGLGVELSVLLVRCADRLRRS